MSSGTAVPRRSREPDARWAFGIGRTLVVIWREEGLIFTPMEGARISGLGADGSTHFTVNLRPFCAGMPHSTSIPLLRFTPGGNAPDTMLQCGMHGPTRIYRDRLQSAINPPTIASFRTLARRSHRCPRAS
jgi:hypothetical protein